MIKFVTIIDGKAMLYTQYDTGNCYAKPVLDGRAKFIPREEFNRIRTDAKYELGKHYEEVVK